MSIWLDLIGFDWIGLDRLLCCFGSLVLVKVSHTRTVFAVGPWRDQYELNVYRLWNDSKVDTFFLVVVLATPLSLFHSFAVFWFLFRPRLLFLVAFFGSVCLLGLFDCCRYQYCQQRTRTI